MHGEGDLCEVLKTLSAWSLERNDVSIVSMVFQEAFLISAPGAGERPRVRMQTLL